MPDWIDTPAEVLLDISIVVALISVFGAFFGALRWLIRALNAIEHEMKPNSGQSMRDAIDRLENRQIGIAEDVKNAAAQFHSHIQWHLDQEAK